MARVPIAASISTVGVDRVRIAAPGGGGRVPGLAFSRAASRSRVRGIALERVIVARRRLVVFQRCLSLAALVAPAGRGRQTNGRGTGIGSCKRIAPARGGTATVPASTHPCPT